MLYAEQNPYNFCHSQLGGQLQSMLMSQSLSGFAAQHRDTVMILHAPNHWVTVAATEDEINYVDSLRPHQQISPYVMHQLLHTVNVVWCVILVGC